MGLIYIPERRLRANQWPVDVPVEIDEGSSLSDDLAVATIPSKGGRHLILRAEGASVSAGIFTPIIDRFGRGLRGGANIYQGAAATLANAPLSVAFTVIPKTVTGTKGVWSFGNTGIDGAPRLLIQSFTDALRIYYQAAYQIEVSGIFAVGAPVTIVFTHNGSAAYVYVNGVLVGSKSASFGVGSAANWYFGSGYNGQLDAVYGPHYQWRRVLSAAEVADISANMMRPLRPLRRKLFVPVANGGGADLSGAATGQSSASAALAINLPLTAAALATASGNASLSTSISISGDAVAQAGANGSMVLSVPITGAALSQALAQAGLGSLMPMAGAAQGAASGSADLSLGNTDLSGAANGNASGSGSITLTMQMSGAALAQALASGDLSSGGSDLSGAAQGSASASAVMWMALPLAGAASVVASGVGDVSMSIPIQGAAAAVGTAVGGMSLSVTMSAAAAAQAAASGAMVLTVSIDGAALSQAAASGALNVSGEYVRPPASRLSRVWPEARHHQVQPENRRWVA